MRRFALLLFAVSAVWTAQPSRADVFVLSTGGKLTGELLNPDENPRQIYVIRTVQGAEVTLKAEQVLQVITPTAAESEYQKIRAKFPDTVEGNWELADWCRDQNLPDLRRKHLERILELDEHNKDARVALGYRQIRGQWVTEQQFWEEKGFVRYKGQWRLPQEIQIFEAEQRDNLAEKTWFTKLARMKGALQAAGARPQLASAEIAAIDDPYAIAALTQALKRDTFRPLRLLYVEALRNIGTPAALKVLADCALTDRDDEVRVACYEQLAALQNPEVTPYFIHNLKNSDNVQVNRAAVGLAYLKDPASVEPLIDALVTTHKQLLAPAANPGQISSTFGSDSLGGSGMSFGTGGSGPVINKQIVANRPVLETLVNLTGENFNFDVAAWKNWYASQKKASPNIDLSRDDF